MTGRERLNAVMHKEPVDRLSWTTLVDSNTLDNLPGELRGISAIDFYRHIGCDILMLNGWATPHGFNSPKLEWGPEAQTTHWSENGRRFTETQTPNGTLKSVSRKSHPIKYPVETIEDVRIYRELWEGAAFAEADDRPSFDAVNELIEDDGIVTRFWGPSTIPRLLEFEMGTENFYYLLHDYPHEMEELIALMHERELVAFEILGRGPCEVVMLVENTSTYYIGPHIYRHFNGPHVKDFVDTIHDAGKVPIIHMCGHVVDILPDIEQTGLDGVHALTPPPTGNTPWENALDVLGEDAVIIGALDPSIFISGPVENIGSQLDALYTPRLRNANFVLGPFADGIPVPLERFLAISEWMARNS
ncbi:MAG: uroporphyrinogen decarboxylase family protein [Planctomycetota bacterium]|jgi:hypothetical protein|nr:uroporphyrinogen decarboxylase family protein [Planctomycetota bacterium]MDP7129485.1 uroporphyrinogen decarboxylase family protein [Planctomycetota bacterium]MDP7251040.1 uroporphyrinogen decarboxylase family protein [Planctomycetota bacterium]